MSNGIEWLWAFLFTQVVEVPIYVVGARTRVDEGFCASAITHPVVWFLIPMGFDFVYLKLLAPHPSLQIPDMPRYWIMVVIAEIFAIVAEGFYLRWLKKPHPFRWALAANLTSVTLGLLSRNLFGVP